MIRELTILVILSIICYAYAVSNYGPFNLSITEFTYCKGPKRRDCAVSKTIFVNDTVLICDINVIEDMKDLQGNLFATSENKQVIRFQLKKICDHPFWLPFMRSYLNITKDCVIAKGHYKSNINAQDIARNYYGGSFVYGKWTIRSVYYNSVCNFGCANTVISVTPKK